MNAGLDGPKRKDSTFAQEQVCRQLLGRRRTRPILECANQQSRGPEQPYARDWNGVESASLSGQGVGSMSTQAPGRCGTGVSSGPGAAGADANISRVPDADLVRQVIETSQRLISGSPSGDVEGEDVARELGRDTGDMNVYWAFQEARRQGTLEMYFPGGMALPTLIRLP